MSPPSHHDHDHDHDHTGHGHTGHGHTGHGHGHHGHSHGIGGHSHAPANFDRAFAVGVTLNISFVVIEAGYGLYANSLALLADAAHNLGDVLGLLMAWGAVVLARRRPTRRRTYGYGRSSILASLANAMVLLISVGGIAVEAIQRLMTPEPIAGTTVMIVASIGVLINGVTAWMFMSGAKGDINIKGAFQHMAADALLSLGVVVAALVIGFTGWLWLDPMTSLLIGVVITIGTWGLLKEALNLALDAVPSSVDHAAVDAYLRGLPDVIDVHDLHIWALSTTETALTAHLVRSAGSFDDGVTMRVALAMRQKFGIGHVTIQLESAAESARCALAPEEVV